MDGKDLNIRRILSFFLPSFYWLALLAVPLGMSYLFPVASPFVSIKSAWLQILSALTLLVFLFFTIFSRGRRQGFLEAKKWWRAILPVWILWLALSVLSIWSFNSWQSWFGSYLRQTGILFYFWLAFWYSFLIYYFGGFYQSENRVIFWLRGVRLSALLMSIAGSLAGIYAFLQFCGFDFAVWQESQLYSRAIGTLGQPNFLGAFLLFALAMAAYYFFDSKKFFHKFFALLMFVCQLAGLIVSASRAAWLAAIVAVIMLLVLSAWQRWRWRTLAAIPILLLLFSAFFYLLMPARFSSLRDVSSGTLALRLSFYRSSFQIIKEHPWLGVGWENGGEAFITHYQPEWGALMNVDSSTDRAHNGVVDIIIQTGIIGLFFWILLYIFWAWQCWQLYRSPLGRKFALASIFSLTAYSLTLMVGISDISSIFYFWVIAALVSAGNLSLGEKVFLGGFFARMKGKFRFFARPLSGSMLREGLIKIGGGVLGVLALVQIYFSLSSLQADYYFLQIRRLLPAREYFTISVILSYLDRSALNPVSKSYYHATLASYALSDWSNLEDLNSQYLVRNELSRIFSQSFLRGYDAGLLSARLQCFLSGVEQASPLFEKLIAASPERPALYRDYAQCWQSSGGDKEALSLYGEVLNLLPSTNHPLLNDDHRAYLNFYTSRVYIEMALIQENSGHLPQALQSWRLAYSAYPNDLLSLQKRADIYVRQKEYDSALFWLQHAYQRQPGFYYWPLAIANVYDLLGEDVLAESWHQQALRLNPDLEPAP
ncbi:MAG: O-antigen ligase family protein [Patescibacteria group bacterium]|nr:O-antigen ligase family protein [Patescibacteria group bacterium]